MDIVFHVQRPKFFWNIFRRLLVHQHSSTNRRCFIWLTPKENCHTLKSLNIWDGTPSTLSSVKNRFKKKILNKVNNNLTIKFALKWQYLKDTDYFSAYNSELIKINIFVNSTITVPFKKYYPIKFPADIVAMRRMMFNFLIKMRIIFTTKRNVTSSVIHIYSSERKWVFLILIQ